MRIPDVDADPNPATKFVLLIQLSISCDETLNCLTFCCFSKNRFTSKGQSSENLVQFFFTYMDSLGMNKNL